MGIREKSNVEKLSELLGSYSDQRGHCFSTYSQPRESEGTGSRACQVLGLGKVTVLKMMQGPCIPKEHPGNIRGKPGLQCAHDFPHPRLNNRRVTEGTLNLLERRQATPCGLQRNMLLSAIQCSHHHVEEPFL